MTDRTKKILKGFASYAVIFVSVAFLVTCTTALFVSVLSTTLGISLDSEQLNAAAKLTFANVVFISLLITVIDEIRRRLTTKKTIAHIVEATERVIGGDFSVRIEKPDYPGSDDFEDIINSFNKMAEELSGVETLRTDFIANVSHEMKTPLAVMQNYGTLLQSPDLSEEKRIEYARAITDASRRLSDMMTNILKLNRLENQQIYPNPTTFDLGEQLCESLLQYESVWERRNIEIETNIAEEVFVSADAELLSLVWNNLFSNAFKFTDEGGRVTLTLTADENYATVVISDTGCGMSAEVGAHIFEKFYQGDSSRATQGNGLGLALVKRVVDITQGEISVESALGVGSTFTVKIKRRYGD